MEENKPKIEFELGREVSPGNFFKSSFARSIVSNCRDIKSLDTHYMENLMNEDHSEGNLSTDTITSNNNYFSLNTFDSPTKIFGSIDNSGSAMNEADASELNHLRKQCQTLTEENQRLNSVLKSSQAPRIQVMDNVLLQTQVDTLKWQLKQAEANQQMYRSLMRQVARFLDRTKKSLDHINEKNSSRKGSSARNNRSQSVYIDETTTISTVTTPITNSRFTRAKSVTQIPTNNYSGFREFTWSVLRRNDAAHCAQPRVKGDRQTKEDLNKTHSGVVYRRANKDGNTSEENGEHVPTDKLSQEAFRLMRTVESLLSMRHPDLAIVSSSSLSSTLSSASSSSCASSTHEHTIDDDNNNISVTQFHDDTKRANSTLISDGSFMDDELSFRSLNSTFLNAECKTIEEEKKTSTLSSISRQLFKQTGSSTLNSRTKKIVKEDRLGMLKDVNSADDESGFSSMNSFHDVGLPMNTVLSTFKGCHTEIGLPHVPIDKTNHRRWSSTPVELQTILKKYNTGFIPNRSNVESLSVWV